jgi:hypothetical protein
MWWSSTPRWGDNSQRRDRARGVDGGVNDRAGEGGEAVEVDVQQHQQVASGSAG